MSHSSSRTLGSVISVSKGKKHEPIEVPSVSSKRLIGIDDLRNDNLFRYTDDKGGTEAIPNDILIAWDGANAGTIGYGKKGYIGSTIARLRINPDAKLFTPFIGFYLKSKFDYLRQNATGATIPHINRKALDDIPLPAVEFDDQIRIAHLLGKVEGLIAQRKQHLQQLDNLLKSVFLEMFGDPVRNEKGWEKPELRHFGKISTGNTPPRNDPDNFGGEFIEWIKTDNILANTVFVSPATEHLSRKGAEKGRQVTKGALLVACIAGSAESIGRAALTNRSVSFNQQINAIQPNDEVDPSYLYGLFKLCKAYVQSHASKGMKKILTKGDFEQITMIKPPYRLQTQYSKVAEKIETIKSEYKKSLSDLEVLFSALSQKAFAGELDLSRIHLSANPPSVVDVAKTDTKENQSMKPSLDLPAPSHLATLQTADGRKYQINEWLTTWIERLEEAPFVAQDFMDAARQRLSDLAEGDTFDWGVPEYDELKSWVFEALEQGRLTQVYDDANNRVQVKTAKR